MFETHAEFRDLAAQLTTAQRSLSLYPTGHPNIRKSLEDCYLSLRSLLQRERQLPIVIAGKEFVAGDLQVPAEGEVLEEFAAALRDSSIEKLIFLEGLRQWELQSFLRLVNLEPEELRERGGIERALEENEVEHILAGPLQLEPTEEPTPDLLVRAWEVYAEGLKAVRKLRHGVRTKGRIEHLDETKEFVGDLVDVAMQQTRPLLALQALKVHDEYSFTHSINVATLSLAIARGLNFSKYELGEVTLASLLHDVGKERVEGDLLRKPGSLEDEEWEQMEKHSLDGAKMLAITPGVGDLAPIVAYEHHLSQRRSERDDSSPWHPHIVSEIVTIADVYDALRSTRPYRGELPPDQALRIMQEDGAAKFNPDLFRGFERLVGYYPPGTCVRLDTEETGISLQSNPSDLERPQILIVRDAAARPLDPPQRVDLTERDGDEYRHSVVEVVAADEADVDPFDYL